MNMVSCNSSVGERPLLQCCTKLTTGSVRWVNVFRWQCSTLIDPHTEEHLCPLRACARATRPTRCQVRTRLMDLVGPADRGNQSSETSVPLNWQMLWLVINPRPGQRTIITILCWNVRIVLFLSPGSENHHISCREAWGLRPFDTHTALFGIVSRSMFSVSLVWSATKHWLRKRARDFFSVGNNFCFQWFWTFPVRFDWGNYLQPVPGGRLSLFRSFRGLFDVLSNGGCHHQVRRWWF